MKIDIQEEGLAKTGDRREASTSQVMLKIASKPPKAKKKKRRTLLQVSEGVWPHQYLDSDF